MPSFFFRRFAQPLRLLVSLILILSGGVVLAAEGGPSAMAEAIPDRRDNPSKFETGSLLFPVYSHVPGIGSTLGVGTLENNIFGTRSNFMAVLSGGDLSTALLSLTEVHLVKNTLVTDYYLYSTKIPFQVFDRGMTGDPNNYFYSIDKEYGGSFEADLNFWERRVQLKAQLGASRLTHGTITDANTNAFNSTDRGEMSSFNPTFSFLVDLTDDNVDPRKGLKLALVRDQVIQWDGLHSRYHTYYAFATAYVPISRSSTWAFNFTRSYSEMESRNTLSPTQLAQQMGLSCGSVADPTLQASCQGVQAQRVNERYAENQFGNAGQLGGTMEMRGFPLDRFHGSQMIFYGTEFRYNLINEDTKFDFLFVKGTASVLQIAPFYELGAVSDAPTSIEGAGLRSDYGVGFRVGFSGAIVRADVGFSNEGPQFTFFLGYPWDMSPF